MALGMGLHTHKWMFLTTKGYYRPSEVAIGYYEYIEYAIMICNGCHNVIKEVIKTKAEVDHADSD